MFWFFFYVTGEIEPMSTIADLKTALQNIAPTTMLSIVAGSTTIMISAGDLDTALGVTPIVIVPPPAINSTMYASAKLNMRSAPTTSGNVLQVIPAGTALTVIASTAPVTADGHTWFSVQTATGIVGWCASDYLSSTPPVTSGGGSILNGPLMSDLSKFQLNVNLAQAKAAGITAVMHKATQSTGYADPNFAARKIEAANAVLPFGAYHFGVGQTDPVAQADYFLSVAADVTVLALDIEHNPDPQGQTMSIPQMEAFVQHIHSKTGRWPIIYTNPGGWTGQSSQVAAQCPLWVAVWGTQPVVPAPWSNWTIWQFTDGNNGPLPHSIDGIGTADFDRFNGDQAALLQFFQG
jgi:lysozyme